MREKLAELAHNQWSGWMKYLFGKCIDYKPGQVQAEEGALIIPKWAVERWRGQTKTSYVHLSEQEMDSDRVEADKFLAVFQSHLTTETECSKRLSRRDGNAKITLCFEKDGDPFHREDCIIVDFGVSDNRYVIECKVVTDQLKRGADPT